MKVQHDLHLAGDSVYSVSMQKIILLFALAFITSTSAHAATGSFITPLSIGAIPPVQFPPKDYSVTGARISGLFGTHRDVMGIDLGLIGNITENSFTGIALSGLFNITRGTTNAIGAQLAGLTNINRSRAAVYGVQVAGLVNANTAESKIVGGQIALLANVSEFTNLYGVQVGLYNRAREVYGFQIGLVNVATALHGIQIGLANINQTGLIGVSPIINIGF